MKWIIHDLIFGMDEHTEFMACLEKHSQDHEVFSSFAPIPDGDIVRCSVDMAKVWRGHRGIICNWDGLKCSEYYPFFEKHLLGESYLITTYGDLMANSAHYFSLYGKDDYIFIRPDRGGKTFGGELIEPEGLKRHRDWYKDSWSDDILIIIAQPVDLIKEYRVVVIGSTAVSACQYKSKNEKGKMDLDVSRIPLDHPVLQYVTETLKKVDYRPDPAFIVDVADTADGFKIVELNSFTCSGLYDCDPEPIILGMEKVRYDTNTI